MSDDSSDDDRKKHKKSKKKKKKHKKKKKKHKRSDDHSDDERDEKPVKKIKKEKSDSFWGEDKPFDVDSGKDKVGNGESQSRSRVPEYSDERRPVDLGREAKPYPSDSFQPSR